MKKIYTFYLLFFLFLFSISEGLTQGWQQAFGINESNNVQNKILQLEDGNLIVAGTDIITGGSSQIYIKKISPNGEFLEQTNISEDRAIHMNDFIRTSDGGFLAVGQYDGENNRIYVVKMSIDGTILWSKIDTLLPHSSAHAAIELQDGHFLVAGSTASSSPEPVNVSAFMMKLNSAGEVLFTKVYEEVKDNIYSQVLLETSQQEVLMGGYISKPLANPGDTFLGKYDTDGQEIWRTIIPHTATRKLLELDNNTFLIAGNSYGGASNVSLTVIDELGDKIWSNLYSAGHYYTQMGSVVQTEDNGFVISGRDGNLVTTNNPFPEEVYDDFMMKIDEFGNRLSTQVFGGEEEDHLLDIIKTQDGGFAASGYSYSFAGGAKQIYVVKTNADCLISSTLNLATSIPNLAVYPNPFQATAYIDLKQILVKNGQFQLFDRMGNKIQESTFSGSEFILKKNDLAHGLYFFQIIEKGKIIGKGKIIVN